MKIEKINDNKIKVTISLNDLEERNIDLTSLNYNSPAAQELFWDMMEQAEAKFGFNTTDSQLCVEASPDLSNGFIVTITRIENRDDFESIQKYIRSRFKRNDLKVKRKNRLACSQILMYCFDSTDNMYILSRKISKIYTGESTLYRYNNMYYLVLAKNTISNDAAKMLEYLLNEYATKITNPTYYEGYLEEYGEKISEFNALDIINNYF